LDIHDLFDGFLDTIQCFQSKLAFVRAIRGQFLCVLCDSSRHPVAPKPGEGGSASDGGSLRLNPFSRISYFAVKIQ
jgi:hypothetical protein